MIKTISVTGTKGKTTVVNVLATVLQAAKKNVLKVDTTGHYMNGVQKSTLEDSKATWRLVPTVCPGRYLWEFKDDPDNPDNVAVLECALGGSGRPGIGYRVHNVGVFLNVYEDHLGASSRLQTREDIAKAKSFIFNAIEKEGWAVFNADDELVCSVLDKIPEDFGIKLIPCGVDFAHFDVEGHLANGGVAFSLADNKIVLRSQDGDTPVVDLSVIPWAFSGNYAPSAWNLLHVAAALYAYYQGDVPANTWQNLESARLDRYGGRLTLLKAKNGATVIADYAHEKYSLREIGKLARTLCGPDGKVTGVIRLAHDRTDEMMRETAYFIADAFDSFVVYDKIDGHIRQPKNVQSRRFPQVIGRTSEIFANALQEKNQQVQRIIREDEAIARAANEAGPNDVVVVIVNDDIHQSIEFIQESFKAEFV